MNEHLCDLLGELCVSEAAGLIIGCWILSSRSALLASICSIFFRIKSSLESIYIWLFVSASDAADILVTFVCGDVEVPAWLGPRKFWNST